LSTIDHFTLKQTLASGRGVLNGFATIGSTVTLEVLVRQAFGCVTIDMQHGLISYDQALAMLQLLQAYRKPGLCRVSQNDDGELQRALDAGFEGIICPGIVTQQDAARFVSSTRYPPNGKRSFGAARAAALYGPDYVRDGDARILRLAMISSTEAIAAAEVILDVDGIDGVYLAPSDISLSMGFAPTQTLSEPSLADTIAGVQDAAARRGKFTGIHSGSPEGARQALSDGFNLVSLMTDLRIYQQAVQAAANGAWPP
jgi:4-hydroxy-2-oxoheptanedioate aldolase